MPIITAVLDAVCSTNMPTEKRPRCSTDSPHFYETVNTDGQYCCRIEAQHGQGTQINWTKTAHRTQIHNTLADTHTV